jgi:hypothetical protein
MNLVVSLACIQMKLLPEEAWNGATTNGAFAMGLGSSLGSIAIGKLANLIITRAVPSLAYLPYRFGTNLIDKVILVDVSSPKLCILGIIPVFMPLSFPARKPQILLNQSKGAAR